MPRYDELDSLSNAINSGLLPRDTTLVIDNDSVSAWHDGEMVYEAHPVDVLRNALDLLGIMHEPA